MHLRGQGKSKDIYVSSQGNIIMLLNHFLMDTLQDTYYSGLPFMVVEKHYFWQFVQLIFYLIIVLQKYITNPYVIKTCRNINASKMFNMGIYGVPYMYVYKELYSYSYIARQIGHLQIIHAGRPLFCAPATTINISYTSVPGYYLDYHIARKF